MKLFIFIFVSIIGFCSFAEPLEDNSFLVEEAYNQEPGVVQFIQVYQKDVKTKNWDYVFINEIPILDESNQFSYELPLGYDEVLESSQIRDIKLNYRREFFRNNQIVATGRISLVLPTGKYEDGFGLGALGVEGSLITSIKINQNWSQHWNIGYSTTPGAKNSTKDKADVSRYFYALSNIYFFTDTLNFLVEIVGSQSEEVISQDTKNWQHDMILSPGFRTAFDVGNWQFVPGIAYPIGLGPIAGQNQILGYLSIEGKVF